MRPLVPPNLGSEALVFFAELLVLLLKLFVLLLKFINTIFESSDPLKQLLQFLVSDHYKPSRPVQTIRDALPAGGRPSENTLSSALLYC
jgi:hypothetical protein